MRTSSERTQAGGRAAPKSRKAGTDLEYRLDDSIAYRLRNTHRYFVQTLQPLLDRHGISIGMWYYLRALWEEDGLTQREVSDRVGLVAPTTVEQLKNMEKRGLLERRRSDEDRRKIHVHLTGEGKALKAELLPFASLVNAVATEGVAPADIETLRRVLTQMQQNLSAHAAAAAEEAG